MSRLVLMHPRRPRRLMHLPRLLRLLCAGLALAGAGFSAGADTVLVAVAANFDGPLAALTPGFGAATGHRVQVSPGATTRLATQIASGAPYQVLLAADTETPARLVADGMAVPGSAFTYAVGHLVLWSADPKTVDPQGAVLASGQFKHLAIANPKLAPYGQAALDVLRARGLEATLQDRLVMAENIAQAYQFVLTGNAELGFVALSQLMVPGKPMAGSAWRVPASLHRPIRQDAVLLKAGAGRPAALALLAYLKTPAAQAVIGAHGYSF